MSDFSKATISVLFLAKGSTSMETSLWLDGFASPGRTWMGAGVLETLLFTLLTRELNELVRLETSALGSSGGEKRATRFSTIGVEERLRIVSGFPTMMATDVCYVPSYFPVVWNGLL